jgi:cytochrome c553
MTIFQLFYSKKRIKQRVLVATASLTGIVSACSSEPLGDQVIAKWGPKKIRGANTPADSTLNPSATSATGTQASDQPADSSKVTAFSDAEAFHFLTTTCGGCHGPDGSYKANWTLPAKENLSVLSLEGVQGITKAYQSMVNKYLGNESASPSAMPLGVDFAIDPEAKARMARLLKWFNERMVSIVKDADSLYPKDEKSGLSSIVSKDVSVSLNYQCKKLRTGASYLTRLTSALYNRNPTTLELELIKGKEEKQLTRDERFALASRIKTDPASMLEFEAKGLMNFANKVADAAKIAPAQIDQGNAAAVQADLKSEFYQLLRRYYNEKSYRDILLLDKVMVTSRTAPLYSGCIFVVSGPQWQECALTPNRSNFFGTVGFLRARPTSFLENNNNYGRAGAMFVVASGEALLPQTNGPVGDLVNGLPECLTASSKDARARINTKAVEGVDEPLTGPFGTLTVPGFGNVCQGCHVRRGLAAGSKIYRPFGKFGELLSAATIDAAAAAGVNANNPYRDDVRAATSADLANYDNGPMRFAVTAPAQKARSPKKGEGLDKTSPITVSFLKELLAEANDGKGTCIPVDAKTIKPVSTIKDMAEFVVGAQSNVARGLARMIPKALAATQLVNQEIILEVNKASASSQGMLADMMVAYLSTETFACQEE